MSHNLEAKLVSQPILLLSPTNYNPPNNACLQEALNRWITRYDILKSRNYKVKLLGTPKNVQSGQWVFIKAIDSARPDYVIGVDRNWDDPYEKNAMHWVRDAFQIYGDLILSSPGHEQITPRILSSIGIDTILSSQQTFLTKILNKKPVVYTSRLGEGGLVVRDKNTLVVSEIIKDDPYITELKKSGYQIYFLPSTGDKYDSLDFRMNVNNHIDTEFNFVYNKEDIPIVCVNEAYYQRFKSEVDGFINKFNGNKEKMYIIPEDSQERISLAVNFIKLPEHCVVIPSKCPELQSFFEEHLGKESVITFDVNKLLDYHGDGGGLRCMSNLIE